MLPARVGKDCNLWTYADYRLQYGLENELHWEMDWKSADHILFGSDVAVLAETGAFWTENRDERLVDFAQGSPHCSPTDAPRQSLEDGAESSAQ